MWTDREEQSLSTLYFISCPCLYDTVAVDIKSPEVGLFIRSISGSELIKKAYEILIRLLCFVCIAQFCYPSEQLATICFAL